MSNTDTLGAFGALCAASFLGPPFDLAVGLFTLLGLVFVDKTTWGRHVAVFSWMCGRIWPEVIHDSYNVSDVPILILGLVFLCARERVDSIPVGARRSLEITYVVFMMLPVHGPPHAVLGVAFCATCAVLWTTTTPELRQTPEILIKSCVWILCLKTPALALVPLVCDVWFLRRYVALPSTKRTTTEPAPAPPRPKTAPQSRPIRSARVPPEYYSKNTPPPPRKTEDESSELSKYVPIESDEV
jgi:hypothetical protein